MKNKEKINQELWSKQSKNYGKANDFESVNRKFVIDYFSRKKGSLIELCCGNGAIISNIKNKDLKITGLDYNKDMLSYIKDEKIKTLCKRSDKTGVKNSSFDYSICINSLHNLTKGDFEATLKEMSRITKKEAIIEFRNKNHLFQRRAFSKSRKKGYHFYLYTLSEVKKLLKQHTNFKLKKVIRKKYPNEKKLYRKAYVKVFPNVSFILILKK